MGIQIPRDICVDFSNSKYIILNAKQYDSRSRFTRVTCTNSGQKVHLTPDNYSAFIRYRKPDGYSVFNKCIISTDGKIIFELTEQMLSTVGTSYADLVIIDIVKSDINNDTTIISADGKIIENNNSLVSTMNFYINVLERPLDDEDIISTNEFSALNELLNKANKDYEYIVTTTREYMDNAHQSETNAKQSEDNARQSEINSKESEDNAKQSEINAKDSENISLEKAAEAEASQSAAKESENNARQSEINAKQSEDNAKQSEINSADNANLSQSYAVGGTGIRDGEDTDNSKYYKEQAAISETNADISAATATTKANEAATSANTAENAANTATDKATSASESATDAKTAADTSIDKADIATNAAATATTKANEAATSAETSLRNATDASNSATSAQENATKAESFLHGGSGIRENEDTDNSKYYYEQTKDIADNVNIIISYKTEYQQSISGTDIPTGEWSTDIPEVKQGTYLWTRITLIFTNGQTSVNYSVAYSGIDGSGGSASNLEQVVCDSDGNIILDSDENKLSSWGQRYVVGIKGDAERDYRDGNVNITAENVGALPLDGIAKNMDDMLDTHGVSPLLQTFPGDRGIPAAGTPLNNNGFEQYGSLADFITTHRSGFYTTKLADNNWYNILSIRHRNGYSDGKNYGMVLYSYMTSGNPDSIELYWLLHSKADTYSAGKILLDNYNYARRISRLSNQLTLDHGSYVIQQMGNSAGTAGLINFMRIKIIGTYANYPLCFLLSGRGRNLPMMVSVHFISTNNTDPGLGQFYKTLLDTYDIYIYKTGTSQWDLYAPKSEGWGRIDILDLWYSKEHFEITYPNAHVESVNSAWVKAATAGVVNVANCIRDKYNSFLSYLAYSGLNMSLNSNTQYLAMWHNNNGAYEVRTIDKTNFMQAKNANGYYGMCVGNYDDTSYVRTTSNGLIPYQSGNINTGHSSLGTAAWCFLDAYITNIHSKYLFTASIKAKATSTSYIDFDTTNEKVIINNNAYGNISNAGVEYSYKTNSNYFRPTRTNLVYLGSSSLLWNQVYATNSTISTSDRHEKKEISYIGQTSDYDTYMSDETLKLFIRGLMPVIYKRVNGESSRPHHGFIAQDIEELMQKLGIKDHAGFIKSPKTETIEIEEEIEETYTDETDGKAKTRTVIQKREEERVIPGEYIYGLRYEEFIADIVRFVQIQDNEIQEQEEKINKQQEELNRQQEEINDLKTRLKRLEALIA